MLRPLTAAISLALFTSTNMGIAAEADSKVSSPEMDELVVWGEQKESEQAGYTSPVSTLKQKD